MGATVERRVGLLPVLKLVAGSWKYRLVFIASMIGYWIVYSISAGMFFYYSFDLTPFLISSHVPNPYFIMYTQSFMGLYDSGMILYPTNHLQVNLLFGPTFFSIVLSVLFGLNMMVVGYSLSTKSTASRSGLSSFAAIVPAMFSGGCCAVPLGTVLLASFIPATALSTFVYSYVAVTNALFGVLLFVTLAYGARRLSVCCVSA
jgi:hypothetical protein